MTKHKIKIIIILILAFIFANGIVYYATELNKKQRIKTALDDNLRNLQIHFEIASYHQRTNADAAYISTVVTPGFIEIFSQLKTASAEKKSVLRTKLYNLLKKKYEILKRKGVLQYHFVLPSNESFLRMHRPTKFGDDLTDIREDYKYTNETKKAARGFVHGRLTHGFRNTYPIFAKDGDHLGAMEISFSNDSLQYELKSISKIHTHFLVDKDIFSTKISYEENLLLKYVQSPEHENFILTVTDQYSENICITENQEILKDIKEDIYRGIAKGEKFALYTVRDDNHIDIVSFYPIKDFTDSKAVAWIVSYEENDFIYTTLQSNFAIRAVMLLIFAVLGYLLYKQITTQERIEEEHRLLNDVLNSTDDIMFATDLKKVTFSNRKFRDFFSVKDEKEFNDIMDNNLLNIFIDVNGYLHEGLLKEKEGFGQLIARTKQEERVVSILDSSMNAKAFSINITKTNCGKCRNYLVTLTDITKLKEKEIQIQKKAYIDGLTGVYNRNKFNEIVVKELSRDIRYKRSLSVAIIDIDLFKNVNDTYGHLVGDEVLIMLAQYINNNIRETDSFARWGGEEFVILFPETLKDDAKIVCDKLRIGVEKLLHPEAGSITVSFGVTQYIENDTIETLFKRCDDALYEAKENGRNRVCVK